jgi:hypothetical protein
MKHVRTWFEHDVKTSTMDAKCQIDVFKISAKGGGKRSHSQQHIAPVESAAGASAEDVTRSKKVGMKRLAMTTLPGYPSQVIAVAGAVNFGGAILASGSKDEGSDRRHFRIIEAGQGRLGPAGSYLGIIIEQLDNCSPRSADTSVGSGAKASAPPLAEDLHSRKLARCRATTGAAGTIVDHDDFRVGRRMPKQGV